MKKKKTGNKENILQRTLKDEKMKKDKNKKTKNEESQQSIQT